jgi:hypothetical protein
MGTWSGLVLDQSPCQDVQSGHLKRELQVLGSETRDIIMLYDTAPIWFLSATIQLILFKAEIVCFRNCNVACKENLLQQVQTIFYF